MYDENEEREYRIWAVIVVEYSGIIRMPLAYKWYWNGSGEIALSKVNKIVYVIIILY